MNQRQSLVNLYKSDDWIAFMDQCKRAFPFLFKRGRPPMTEIQNSELGRCGYTNWQGYLEHELEWNMSGWCAWLRAYKLVLKYPYLRQTKVTASYINVYARKHKHFPKTLAQWQSKQHKLSPRSKLPENSRIQVLESALSDMKHEIDILKQEIAELRQAKVL